MSRIEVSQNPIVYIYTNFAKHICNIKKKIPEVNGLVNYTNWKKYIGFSFMKYPISYSLNAIVRTIRSLTSGETFSRRSLAFVVFNICW